LAVFRVPDGRRWRQRRYRGLVRSRQSNDRRREPTFFQLLLGVNNLLFLFLLLFLRSALLALLLSGGLLLGRLLLGGVGRLGGLGLGVDLLLGGLGSGLLGLSTTITLSVRGRLKTINNSPKESQSHAQGRNKTEI
jgi:hypothetical protein